MADSKLNRMPIDREWGRLQFSTLLYYLHETNPDNGLVRDKTAPNAPVSIAAVGMALATIPVIVERGVIIREFAAKIALRRLRYLFGCRRVPSPMALATRAFSTIFWLSKRAVASGSVSSPPLIRRFCSRAR
jgi:hypothetical protein